MKKEPVIMIITTHRKHVGARLSRQGYFGNIPYSDVAAAEEDARAMGAQEIQYERF